MKGFSNKLTIFGSAVAYETIHDSTRKTPSLMLSQGLAKNLIHHGNNVRSYGTIYAKNKETPLRTIGAHSANIARKVYLERKQGRKIITIGGDHSVSIGSINGVLEHDPDTIVIIIDDFAQFTCCERHSISFGFLTGVFDVSALSKSKYLKPKLSFEQMAFIGNYDTDMTNRLNIVSCDNKFVAENGGNRSVKYILDKLDPTLQRPIYVSFDIRAINNIYAPSNIRTDVSLMNDQQIFAIMDSLRQTQNVIGMDIVNIDSYRDIQNKTINLGMQCIERLFSKTLKD